MLQGYDVSKNLLDVPIRITPTSNKGAYLALGSDGLRLTANPDEIARINKKGTKKYKLFLRGTPVCHKKDKGADSCERGKNKSKSWNIKKGGGGYSIKSAKEKLMGFRQYCLTYDNGHSGKVEVKPCRRDRKNQLFDMTPVEPEKETPEDDEKKDGEKKNREKDGDCSKKDADSDDENLSRDTFSSSEDVVVFDPKKETPQKPEQTPTPPPYYPTVPQVPMYGYPYVPPQPEQQCVCAEVAPCVCPPDGGNLLPPTWMDALLVEAAQERPAQDLGAVVKFDVPALHLARRHARLHHKRISFAIPPRHAAQRVVLLRPYRVARAAARLRWEGRDAPLLRLGRVGAAPAHHPVDVADLRAVHEDLVGPFGAAPCLMYAAVHFQVPSAEDAHLAFPRPNVLPRVDCALDKEKHLVNRSACFKSPLVSEENLKRQGLQAGHTLERRFGVQLATWLHTPHSGVSAPAAPEAPFKRFRSAETFKCTYPHCMLLHIALCLCAGGLSNLTPYSLIGNKPVQIRSVANPLFSLQVQGDTVVGSYVPSIAMLHEADPSDWTMSDWLLVMEGSRMCHKADNTVGTCGEGDLAVSWKIRMRRGSAFVFKTQTPRGWHCMTLDPVTKGVIMNLCRFSDPFQMFFIRESLFTDFLMSPFSRRAQL
ncbi:UNVERIFIED_CONTAM: hypothetical protein PYX00_011581 [Menopon gallinae]|uniref:Uncharacterized protein n=1 Tax=Menopon gallinae TaxID=328185 RepID=A0AAW2H819_9NEOP